MRDFFEHLSQVRQVRFFYQRSLLLPVGTVCLKLAFVVALGALFCLFVKVPQSYSTAMQ